MKPETRQKPRACVPHRDCTDGPETIIRAVHGSPAALFCGLVSMSPCMARQKPKAGKHPLPPRHCTVLHPDWMRHLIRLPLPPRGPIGDWDKACAEGRCGGAWLHRALAADPQPCCCGRTRGQSEKKDAQVKQTEVLPGGTVKPPRPRHGNEQPQRAARDLLRIGTNIRRAPYSVDADADARGTTRYDPPRRSGRVGATGPNRPRSGQRTLDPAAPRRYACRQLPWSPST